MRERAARLNAWIADHFFVAAGIFVAWTALLRSYICSCRTIW